MHLQAGVQEGAPGPWCWSHVAAPSAHSTRCSSYLSVPLLDDTTGIRSWWSHAQEEPQVLPAPSLQLSLWPRRTPPPSLQQLTCLHIPTAPHGHISGSSFSPRPVPRCCRTGTHRLSSPAVPRPGPFLWLFHILSCVTISPPLRQLSTAKEIRPAHSIFTPWNGTHGQRQIPETRVFSTAPA